MCIYTWDVAILGIDESFPMPLPAGAVGVGRDLRAERERRAWRLEIRLVAHEVLQLPLAEVLRENELDVHP